MSSLKSEGDLNEEKAELEELKEDREEYVEVSAEWVCGCGYSVWVWLQDVADLAEECHDEVVESKGSVRLGRRVESIISQIDQTISQLEGELVGETRLHQLQQERYTTVIQSYKSLTHTCTHVHTHMQSTNLKQLLVTGHFN